MRESAREVTEDFLRLRPSEQLLVLRRVVPLVTDRMEKEELLGFLRDLLGEAAFAERHGVVEGERPTKRPPHRHEQASDEKTRRFLREVAEAADLASGADAASPVAAVLCAITRRISEREGDQLTAELPRGIQLLAACEAEAHRPSPTGDASFDREGFLRSVAEHVGAPAPEEAERLARAVFGVVRRWISEGELRDVESQLPGDMKELIGEP